MSSPVPPPPAFDVQAFLKSARVSPRTVRFATGAVVFAQGAPANSVFFVQEGGVKLSVLSSAGKEAVVAMLGPGDFLGFRTPGCAHHIKNPFGEDLVCLMGGERREIEIAEFPRLGMRLIRTKLSGEAIQVKDQKTIWKFE